MEKDYEVINSVHGIDNSTMKIGIKLHKQSIHQRISDEQTKPKIIELYYWKMKKTLGM